MTRNHWTLVADTARSPELSGTNSEKDSGAQPSSLHAGSGPQDSSAGPCLNEDELLAYRAGLCSEATLARVDAHLDHCASCRELVHYLLLGGPPGGALSASSLPWPMTFPPGALVHERYEIRRFVGRGGMGEVYEAFDVLMGTRVALKTVLCTASDQPQAFRKLKDEVRNAQRIAHPNVCRINELQVHHPPDGAGTPLPFFTMEFIDGERLGNRVRRARLPIADARAIACQLLDGLAAAHARGVLHLDLKSDNVMVRRGDAAPEVVIMDFGLSRALDAAVSQRTSERLQLAGTLPYMSVEQLEGRRDLGPAADIYSFGVVLYEMLTGQLPHRAESLGGMLLRQLKTRPEAPSRLVPELSGSVDRFVLRCLEANCSKRHADAASARRALEQSGQWLQNGASPRHTRHFVVAAAILAVLISLGSRVVPMDRRSPIAGGLSAPPSVRVASGDPSRAVQTAEHALQPAAPAARVEPEAPAMRVTPKADPSPAPTAVATKAVVKPQPAAVRGRSSAALPAQVPRAKQAGHEPPSAPVDAGALPEPEGDWVPHALLDSLLLPASAPLADPDAGGQRLLHTKAHQ